MENKSNISLQSKLMTIIRDDKEIAHGVIFTNGKICVSWLGEYCSMVLWDDFESMKKVMTSKDNNTEFIIKSC